MIDFYLIVGSISGFSTQIKTEIFERPIEFFKMSVPSALFTVQNSLSFLALSHLDAATYQIMGQLKILTTALISVHILKKRLSNFKWFSLLILVAGVSLLQVSFSFLSIIKICWQYFK